MKRPHFLALVALLAGIAWTPPVHAVEGGVARAAVVVGANAAAPGRQPLLYGHRDAEKVAAALVNVGGFRAGDVEVLRDPAGPELRAALKRAIARLAGQAQSVLYFYYSGHSDERALYPAGQPVALDELRALIDAAGITVRIGMVDACRGGAWTRAKGLVPDEPFSVRVPLSLDNEGSVLISSSSGLESAHESEQLQGSFFTHHFVVGMRGAADRNTNGEVTLTEAFDYAKERTIRDSLRLARETQHPSYAVNLRGRRDLVLANVARAEGSSTFELAQKHGPLELIHVDSGVALLELPAGVRRVRLAVPPGRYVVRKLFPESILVKEVTVDGGGVTSVDEADLALVGSPLLSIKSKGRASPTAWTTAAAPERTVIGAPLWIKSSAMASLTVSALSWAAYVKFAGDVNFYNRRLDQFRRFPCTDNPAQLCDRSGQLAPPLTPEQVSYVNSLSEDGKTFQTYAHVAFGTAAVFTVAGGVFLYKWLWGYDDEPQKVALTPLGPGQLGLSALGRF